MSVDTTHGDILKKAFKFYSLASEFEFHNGEGIMELCEWMSKSIRDSYLYGDSEVTDDEVYLVFNRYKSKHGNDEKLDWVRDMLLRNHIKRQPINSDENEKLLNKQKELLESLINFSKRTRG